MKPVQIELHLKCSPLGVQLFIPLCLVFLLRNPLLFVHSAPPLCIQVSRSILFGSLLYRQFFILLPQCPRSRDLLEKRSQLLTLLSRSLLHISLQNQEVPGLGEDAHPLQARNVFSLRHHVLVHQKARTLDSGLNDTSEGNPIQLAVLPSNFAIQLTNEFYNSSSSEDDLHLFPVDEFLQPLAPQSPGSHTEHEAHCIDQV
mmetsp:Transcript_143529/g.459000  ORF Transcript_143529/g.459000 Transcript_143529/m.459000 type:complete len:201 (+) Transcript_143529:2836-3438(+)